MHIKEKVWGGVLLWVRIKQLLKVVTKIRNDTSSSEVVVATTTEVMYGVTVTTYQSVFIKHLKEQPVILRTHLRWEPERGGGGWVAGISH